MPFDSGSMRAGAPRPQRRRREVAEVDYTEQRDAFDDLVTVLPTLTVNEVIELVESGEAGIEDVIAAERVGKARKTVLALVKSDSGKVYPIFNHDSANDQNPVRD
jgi:hypothetical protein